MSTFPPALDIAHGVHHRIAYSMPAEDLSEDMPEDRKLRRKVQNRENQRAHRQRLKESHPSPRRQPFEVHRWRLDHEEPSHAPSSPSLSLISTSTKTKRSDCVSTVGSIEEALQHCQTASTDLQDTNSSKPSPFRDQLLHLVQFNAFRALLGNKYILAQLATFFDPGNTSEPQKILFDTTYPGYSIVLPSKEELPINLWPTSLQGQFGHSTWIDLLPFPQMRNNLIREAASFDHGEFVKDVIGSSLDLTNFPKPLTQGLKKESQIIVEHGADDLTEFQRGLIIWGEPSEMRSWEVTSGFLRKWSWAFRGCEELIEASNRWRISRGERPLATVPRVTEIEAL